MHACTCARTHTHTLSLCYVCRILPVISHMPLHISGRNTDVYYLGSLPWVRQCSSQALLAHEADMLEFTQHNSKAYLLSCSHLSFFFFFIDNLFLSFSHRWYFTCARLTATPLLLKHRSHTYWTL